MIHAHFIRPAYREGFGLSVAGAEVPKVEWFIALEGEVPGVGDKIAHRTPVPTPEGEKPPPPTVTVFVVKQVTWIIDNLGEQSWGAEKLPTGAVNRVEIVLT